jgi:hypothetical protein
MDPATRTGLFALAGSAIGLLGGWVAGRQRLAERREEVWARRREAAAEPLAQTRKLLSDVRLEVLVWGGYGDAEDALDEARERSAELKRRADQVQAGITVQALAHPDHEVRDALDALPILLTDVVTKGTAAMLAQARGSDSSSKESDLDEALNAAEVVLAMAEEAIRAAPPVRWRRVLRRLLGIQPRSRTGSAP